MSGSTSNFGGAAPGASNGIGLNGGSNSYELGGNLTRPTILNTSAANTLAITGLTAGDPSTDSIMVVDPTGVTKFINVSGLPDFWRSGIGDVLPNSVTDHTDQISHDGNVGLGITDASTVRARLDVNGAVIHRAVSIANIAANGAIGTAAATVDAFSFAIINQTSANITATIPSPTQTQNGRLLIVGNTGTQAITVGGQVINVNTGLPFAWTGTAWIALGTAPADFWRTITNALPDNVSDTTDTIRRLGHVGIGGALITDAAPTVTTPSATANNYLQLSAAAANRGQLMYGNDPVLYYMTRTVPTVLNDYVDIGSFTSNAQSSVFALSVTVSDGGFAASKYYVAALDWHATANVWRVLRPLSDGGAYNGNNYEILVNVNNGIVNLRLRRTAGATVGTARIYLQVYNDPSTVLTESVTTGNDPAAYTEFNPFTIDWRVTGNTGTTPTAYNDNGAQINNFLGTLDNQAVEIYTNASNANAKSDLRLYPAVPTGAGIAASTDIFHVRRNGQTGVVNPQILTIALGHWLADGNGRTRADIRLLNGGGSVADYTPLSLFSQGGVGINGNGTAGDWSWSAAGGIGRGNGGALLAMMGANGSLNVGPHIAAWTQADTFPLYYQLNWTHDNQAMLFDAYFDGNWRYSHTSRPYAIYKLNGALNFYGSAAVGVAGNVWAQDLMARFRYAGATLTGGELDFNNVVKNRRIVLWDTNAASDHQFYGFGINNSMLRYQVDSVNADHVFYAGTAAATSNEIARIKGNGRVSIGGNANPNARLYVEGANANGGAVPLFRIVDTNIAGSYLAVENGAGATAYRVIAQGSNLELQSAGNSNQLVLNTNGGVGIGTAAPVAAAGNLTITGRGFRPGGGAWTAVSDRRIKRNVKPVKWGLPELLKLNPVSFEYNGLAGTIDDSRTHYSLIAQELQEVIPDFVEEQPITEEVYDSMDKDNQELFANKKLLIISEGMTNLEAVIINSIKSLADENKALRKRIAALEGKLS